LLAAARGALEMGRAKRACALLEPLVNARGPAWIQAAFMLAKAFEASGEAAKARPLLESVASEAAHDDDKALALWSLGRLAENESAAALSRAVEHYRRIADVSTARIPKALLDARIERLRRDIGARRGATTDKS
jgi:hypothetical protein